MSDEIIAGLVVAALVGLFGWSLRKAPEALRRGREKMTRRRGLVMTRAVHLQLMEGIGEANLVHLMYRFPELSHQKPVVVEIETPDAQQVWSVNVPVGYKMSDLALAARSNFKLSSFYRLVNKARQSQVRPNDQIESSAQSGDRLALVEHPDPWGWESKKRGRIQRLVDKMLGVRPIKHVGPGGS